MIERCQWVGTGRPLYEEYHDHEWGVPVHDDARHFEFLILEGAQAGLSWWTILQRRDGYRRAFHNFDANRVAAMTDEELEKLMHNEGIIRNRLKTFSARKNARVFIDIQKEFGSFDAYLWAYVNGKPVINRPASLKDLPVTSPISDVLSTDLKKRGMSFVGSTIMYAYMQAVGMVDDHVQGCFRCPV